MKNTNQLRDALSGMLSTGKIASGPKPLKPPKISKAKIKMKKTSY